MFPVETQHRDLATILALVQAMYPHLEVGYFQPPVPLANPEE